MYLASSGSFGYNGSNEGDNPITVNVKNVLLAFETTNSTIKVFQ